MSSYNTILIFLLINLTFLYLHDLIGIGKVVVLDYRSASMSESISESACTEFTNQLLIF